MVLFNEPRVVRTKWLVPFGFLPVFVGTFFEAASLPKYCVCYSASVSEFCLWKIVIMTVYRTIILSSATILSFLNFSIASWLKEHKFLDFQDFQNVQWRIPSLVSFLCPWFYFTIFNRRHIYKWTKNKMTIKFTSKGNSLPFL